MAFGTKHRQTHEAGTIKAHLRAGHADKRVLVEEFIAEFEGKERDEVRWSKQFADERRIEAEMLQRADLAFEKWLSGA
jgi:hypothetical protein